MRRAPDREAAPTATPEESLRSCAEIVCWHFNYCIVGSCNKLEMMSIDPWIMKQQFKRRQEI